MRLNSEKVKVARDKAGITEEELIIACGLQVCGICAVNGKHTISPMRVKKISKVLGVNEKEIIIEDYEGEVQHAFK